MAQEMFTVVITGLVVVFAVLILLTFLIWAYGKIVYSIQNRDKGSADSTNTEKKTDNVANVGSKAPMQAAAAPQGIPNEVLAVIAAAVASMGSATGVTYAVRSVRREGTARPAWRSAGVYENSRPFSS